MRLPLLALALALAVPTGPALAQRPATPEMSCRQAKALVDRSGGLVLGTGGQTYDRFVRDRSFCEVTEITVPAFVPAGDTPRCFVGYRCKAPSRNWLDDF